MPEQFWAVIGILALLAVAIALTTLVGRGPGQSRMELVALQRLLKATRRLNDDVIAAAKKESPSVEIVKAPKYSEYTSWLHRKHRSWRNRYW
jgi:hypothetical protein